MHFLIIIDHPHQNSFNHHMLQRFTRGLKEEHSYDVLDLAQEDFDPTMSEQELAGYGSGKFLDPKIEEYQQLLLTCEHLVLIFPIWWLVMPARLKGWLDKVLLPGFAFTTDQAPLPLLGHIRAASVLTTSGVTDAQLRREYHDTVEWVLCKGTLEFCGVGECRWLNFGEVGFASQEKHARWLDYIEEYARDL